MLGLTAAVVLVAIVAGFVVFRSASGHASASALHSTRKVVGQNDLTVAAATEIAHNWFLRRDVARYSNDDATLSALESGVALRVDQAMSVRIACGCEATKHRHVLDGVSVVVPDRQSRLFLAHFAVTSSQGLAAGYTVVFVKPTSGTWRAAELVLDGHAVTIQAPATATGVGTQGRKTIQAVANFLMQWRKSGARPRSSMSWTGLVGEIGRQWAQEGQDRTDPRTHIHRHYWVSVEPTTYAIRIADGFLTCGVLDVNDVATSKRGPLYQDPLGRNWGAQLRPGIYPALVEKYTAETCVITRTTGERDLLSLYGTTTAITPLVQPSTRT